MPTNAEDFLIAMRELEHVHRDQGMHCLTSCPMINYLAIIEVFLLI